MEILRYRCFTFVAIFIVMWVKESVLIFQKPYSCPCLSASVFWVFAGILLAVVCLKFLLYLLIF